MQSATQTHDPPIPAHVKVKRMKHTYFVAVDLQNDTVHHLRQRAAHMMAVHSEQLRICRFSQDGITPHFLQDDQQLSQLSIEADDIILAVLFKNGDWETPYITPYPREKRPSRK